MICINIMSINNDVLTKKGGCRYFMNSHALKKGLVILIVLAAVAALITVLLSGSSDSQPIDDKIPVKVHVINDQATVETISVPGTTKSAERVLLRFQVSGRVLNKQVSLGDSVLTGAVLAELDNPEIKPLAERAIQNRQQAQVQFEQAQRDYQRIDDLFKEQAVTKQEWEQVKTRLDSARTAISVAQAEAQRTARLVKELQLKAPFNSVVTEILIDQGEVVQAGTPAIRLSNPNAVELELAVSDVMIQSLAVGQTVKVQRALDPTASAVEGVISNISPFRERASLPQIVIALPAADIQPGVAVSAHLDITRAAGLSIPIKSVLMTGENTSGVYLLKGKQVSLVPVTPLKINNETVLVESTLTAGDQIVTAGIAQLYNGASVNVVK